MPGYRSRRIELAACGNDPFGLDLQHLALRRDVLVFWLCDHHKLMDLIADTRKARRFLMESADSEM